MILPPHASLLRIETIRLLLAEGRTEPEIAGMYAVTRQAIYATIERNGLDQPLRPLDHHALQKAPYLQLTLDPTMAQRLVQARIIETLLNQRMR